MRINVSMWGGQSVNVNADAQRKQKMSDTFHLVLQEGGKCPM